VLLARGALAIDICRHSFGRLSSSIVQYCPARYGYGADGWTVTTAKSSLYRWWAITSARQYGGSAIRRSAPSIIMVAIRPYERVNASSCAAVSRPPDRPRTAATSASPATA
jgi:hypothetical protein